MLRQGKNPVHVEDNNLHKAHKHDVFGDLFGKQLVRILGNARRERVEIKSALRPNHKKALSSTLKNLNFVLQGVNNHWQIYVEK